MAMAKVTKTNRSTGKKTTTAKKLTPVTSESYIGGMAMKRTSKPLAKSGMMKRTSKPLTSASSTTGTKFAKNKPISKTSSTYKKATLDEKRMGRR